ncbi:tRNA (adenosine(37)-N6)-threonylcarbamoyltransferase complex dimerization subunit type 1 TsaB [Dendrosporobacter sp. 1207_IL3150]|uniref:tRNA (adenosine(37)-N6)-threonylcarbamoyltransferase complex dimerization subunit type 1 TsaB n=1 Tax=Dendrosporobacter sp. 1207_IL3150 TaxID=3084054 RepID=UPI002FDAA175
MPILALDTATLVSSVALATQDTLVAELTIQTKLTHSELLMPHISQILSAAKLNKSDLKAIAVSIGPGSFTGLRIGLATAKAIAYALNIPLVGVPTLTALAYNCPVPEVYLAPMLDAQKNNVYTALYRWESGELRELQPAQVGMFDEVLEKLTVLNKPVMVMGEAAVMKKEHIISYGDNILLAPAHLIIPRAASVAVLGHKMLNSELKNDVMTLEPLYIRRSEAEELWERRNGVCG